MRDVLNGLDSSKFSEIFNVTFFNATFSMQHSINFQSIKSKLLLSFKVSCASHFELVVKDTTPRVLKFIISQFFCLFYIISTLATYFNKKLRTIQYRRFTKPGSDFIFVQFFFIHPVYMSCDFVC